MANIMKKLILVPILGVLVAPVAVDHRVLADREQHSEVLTFEGWLRDGESETISVWLRQGRAYSVSGSCDIDCDDLDLEVRRNGALIAEDKDDDPTPVVTVTPTLSGKYDVKVIMYSCSENPCGYELNVFSR